ncbi:MAG: TolC family protein [bacterium]
MTIFLFIKEGVASQIYPVEGITLFGVKDAVKIALDNNKQLLVFKKKLDEASHQVKMSQSEMYPKLNLSGGLSYTKWLKRKKYPVEFNLGEEKITDLLEEPAYPPYNPFLSLSLSQNLFDRGKTQNTIKLSQENLKELEIDYQLLAQQITEEVAEAYYICKKTMKTETGVS